MTKRLKKGIKFILIAFLLVAAGFILYSVTVYQKDYPEYSTHNTKGDGIKALYLLADRLGYPVERNYYPARFITRPGVMVVYRPDISLFNEQAERESLLSWLQQGNTLLLIPDETTLRELWIFEMISDKKQWHEVVNIGDITVTWYGLPNGTICVMDRAESFLNSSLGDSDASVAFIRALEKIGYQDIFFNEYYHNLQKAAPGVWELIGPVGRLVVIQLILALLLVVARGWKPFGRVRGEKELVKRPENEVLKALSGLYVRMRAYPLTLTNYYGYFTQKYDRFLKTPGPLQQKAVHTVTACRHYIEEGSGSKKDLVRLVRQLEWIEEQIQGR